MYGLVLAVAAATPAAPPADPDPRSLAVPAADRARAAALVDRLADPDYDVRETAHRDLAVMGRRALPALALALARNPSPEVRGRCHVLQFRARAEDVQARLAAFAADAAGAFDHELPGWVEFQHVTAGCGPAARQVFAEIAATPLGRELVLSDLPAEELGRRVAARKMELYTARFAITRTGQKAPDPPLADVLAVMIAEARVSAKLVPRTPIGVDLYGQQSLAEAVAGVGDRARVYRAIVGKWVVTRDDPIAMLQAVQLAENTLDLLPEAAALGARMLTVQGMPATYRAPAAMAVARVGNPKYLPVLEAAFQDVGPVIGVAGGVGAAAAQVQMRDVALAAAVLLTGQDPRDYGFAATIGGRGNQFQFAAWRLPADRRDGAFEQWRAWRADNPDYGRGSI